MVDGSVSLDIPAYTYKITVKTGLKLRAGTNSTVWFTVYGRKGDSGVRYLGTPGKVGRAT